MRQQKGGKSSRNNREHVTGKERSGGIAKDVGKKRTAYILILRQPQLHLLGQGQNPRSVSTLGPQPTHGPESKPLGLKPGKSKG